MTNTLQNLINKKTWLTSDALKLVELGADPNTRDSNGQPLIHLLVNYDHEQIKPHNLAAIDTLVNRYKADINARNAQNLTALQCLINRKRWFTHNAMKLVQLGADPNTQDSNGQSLIHLLVNYDHAQIKSHNLTAIDTLVNQYKADINANNAQGLTPLQCVMNRKRWFTHDALELVKLGANPNTQNSNGQPLIHLLVNYDAYGIKAHNHHAIEILVNVYKANINEKNKQGQTALECLLNNPYGFSTKDALLLVRLGANPNTTNSQGETLLHLLATSNLDNSLVIRELIDTYKSDYTIRNGAKKTALDVGAIKTHRNTANAYELMKFDVHFKNEVRDAIQNNPGKLAHLNKLISAAHSANDSNSYALQGTIREIAFNSLVSSMNELSPGEKIKQLEWARNQPLFCMHRSHFFLARLGRTNTVIKIDKMIADIQENNPEMTHTNSRVC